MYARIAAFEGGTQETGEILRKLYREQFQPQSRELQGYAGSLGLYDAGSGRSLAIILFDSQASLEAGDQHLDSMSPPPELEGTRRISVERYELAFGEITAEPGAARVSRLEGPADRIDEGTSFAQNTLLPRAQGIEGWRGILDFVDRQTGKTVIVTLWETTEALQASEEQANQLRQDTADAAGETIKAVERYEVVGASIPAEITTAA